MLGREIFPSSGTHQFQLRFRAPAGTMFENTERLATGVLADIKAAAGPENVDVTLGYVGVQPSSYPINTIFLWTGRSHEGVIQRPRRRDDRCYWFGGRFAILAPNQPTHAPTSTPTPAAMPTATNGWRFTYRAV